LVTDWLEEQKIHFVPKDLNPLKLPEARPIEDFWAILKRDVYMDGWTANNVDKLEFRIRYCLRKIDFKAAQELVATTYKRLLTLSNPPIWSQMTFLFFFIAA
jgi:hypothetical protein